MRFLLVTTRSLLSFCICQEVMLWHALQNNFMLDASAGAFDSLEDTLTTNMAPLGKAWKMIFIFIWVGGKC